jgi:hypothetical protein
VWVWVWWRISLGAPRRNNSARARYRPPALRFIRVPRRSSEVRDLYKKKKKSSLFFFIFIFWFSRTPDEQNDDVHRAGTGADIEADGQVDRAVGEKQNCLQKYKSKS